METTANMAERRLRVRSGLGSVGETSPAKVLVPSGETLRQRAMYSALARSFGILAGGVGESLRAMFRTSKSASTRPVAVGLRNTELYVAAAGPGRGLHAD